MLTKCILFIIVGLGLMQVLVPVKATSLWYDYEYPTYIEEDFESQYEGIEDGWIDFKLTTKITLQYYVKYSEHQRPGRIIRSVLSKTWYKLENSVLYRYRYYPDDWKKMYHYSEFFCLEEYNELWYWYSSSSYWHHVHYLSKPYEPYQYIINHVHQPKTPPLWTYTGLGVIL